MANDGWALIGQNWPLGGDRAVTTVIPAGRYATRELALTALHARMAAANSARAYYTADETGEEYRGHWAQPVAYTRVYVGRA